MSYGAREGTSR